MSQVPLELESPADDFLDALLEESKPVPTIEVATASNRVLRFRQIQSYDEMVLFRQASETFLKTVKNSPHDSWAHLVPKQRKSIATAFTIHELSVEPKISIAYAFKIVNQAPYLAEQIINEVASTSSKGVHDAVLEAMGLEGNESGQTDRGSDETSSTSAESTFEPTQID